MAKREIRCFEILRRHNLGSAIFSSPADFELSYEKSLEPTSLPKNTIPYCLNLHTERMLYTVVDDVRATFSAPFLYMAQRELALKIVTVPFEQISDIETHSDSHPTLVFSVGRCGSTLLSALVRKVDLQSASEPDLLTQMTAISPSERRLITREIYSDLIRGCISSLARLCGDNVVIKLRSHCIAIADDIISASKNSTVLFMFRDRRSWAKSRHVFFGESPELVSNILIQGIRCFDNLQRQGRNPKLVWYEDLVKDPPSVLRTLLSRRNLSDPIILDRLRPTLETDAQGGTGLARRGNRGDIDCSDFINAFDEAWKKQAPVQLINTHGLWRLA